MVVHFFAASWSPECSQMEGVINELAKDHPKVKFYRVRAREREYCMISVVNLTTLKIEVIHSM